METPHKPAHKRMSSPVRSSESSQNQLKLQQEIERLVREIHKYQLEYTDYKHTIQQQAKQIEEYKSYYTSQSLAQECIALKKENGELKANLTKALQRITEYENNDLQEELTRLKRALRSANYNLDLLKTEKENVNPKSTKPRNVRSNSKLEDSEAEQPPTTLGKRKASDLSPALTPPTKTSELKTSDTTSSSSAPSASSSSSSSSSASSTSSSSSASSASTSSTAVIPSDSKVKGEQEEADTARGKKRGREAGGESAESVEWPSQSTALSDFESDSDISLSPPPATVAKVDNGNRIMNALEHISVIGAQVSSLESLLQQQQLRADTERRRNLDLRKEHEHLRKKNASISSDLETKMKEVQELQQAMQHTKESIPKKSAIRVAVEAVSQIEQEALTRLMDTITRHEQRLGEMTKLLHSLDQKRQHNIAAQQKKAQEFHLTESQLRTQLREAEATNRLQAEQAECSRELMQKESIARVDAATTKLREHESQIEQLLAERLQSQAKFQETELQAQGKDSMIHSLQVQVETARQTNDDLTKKLQIKIEELDSRTEASRVSNEGLAKQIDSARETNAELAQALHKANTMNTELQGQIETLRHASEESVSNNDATKRKNEDLLQQIENARAMHTEASKQLETARAMNEDLSNQAEELRKSKLELAEEVTRLGQVILSNSTNLGGLEETNRKLFINVANLEERAKELTNEKLGLQSLLEELNTKLASTEGQAEELRRKQKEAADEYQKLSEQHQRSQQELTQTQAKLDGLIAQRNEMQAALAQDQKEMTSLREKVSQLASTASAVVEAKTHELQRQAHFFQDQQQQSTHAALLPEALNTAVQEDSGAEEETERTPPTPVLAENDGVKTRSQTNTTSPAKPRRSTRRRLAMLSEGAEADTVSSSPMQVRVLFTGWKDRAGHPEYPYSIAKKNQLAQIVSELGGIVPPDQEKLDKKFTHMCVPPECRTAKSLGAALMGKFVVPPQWVLDSKAHGCFQPEAAYGASTQQQLKGKVFYVSESFKARWGSREEKMVHVALKLIVTCGSGIDWSVAKDPSIPCDFTLVGDEQEVVAKSNEPMPRVLGKLLTWDAFLDSVAVSSPVSSDAAVGPSLNSPPNTRDGLTVSPDARKRALETAPTPPKNSSPAKKRHLPSSPNAPSNRRRYVPSPSSPARRSSRTRDVE